MAQQPQFDFFARSPDATRRLTVVNVAYPLAPVSRATAGGAEQIVAAIDAALVAHGHRSIVIACDGSEIAGEHIATPRVDGVLDGVARHAAWARHREALLSAMDHADVVHLHGLDFHEYLPVAKAIVTVHLPPSWYPRHALTRAGVTYVCVSEHERAEFPGRAEVIANGVDLDVFGVRRSCRRFATTDLLAVGRICPEKNFHEAVAAAKRADADLVIAGELFAYPEHERYFRETLAPSLDARRRFIGAASMPEKRDLYASARAVLIPSLADETSSLVAMEALACGTPVIAYRSGALPEIVDHGVTGFIVDGIDAMAAAIACIDDIDRAACRRAAEERFDIRAMTERYLALYSAVACNH